MSEEWKYDENSGSFRMDNQNSYHYDNRYSRRQSESDFGSWALIAFTFILGLWPVGLFLLVKKLSDDSSRARRGYASTRTATTTATTRTATTQERTSGVRKTPQRTATRETTSRVSSAAQRVTKSPADTDKSLKMLRVIGMILAAIGAVGLLSEMGDLIAGSPDWGGLFYALGFAAGGVTTLFYRHKMLIRRNRIESYKAVMGDRDFVKLGELSAITGKSAGVVEKDVEYMLQKKMLGTGAFYDAGHEILFRSADAYQRYLTERSKKENLTPKEAQEGYSGALRAIREANDRIPDPVFSEKLDHMEEIAGKIFREVESHPEKQKQASTFFDYYLPTTLKLLATYTEFEEAGVEGENLRQAKERIESIMDTLLENFEKQLDELYRSEAMDVDADIRVMENMLSRDLSSVERDFGLNGGTAVQTKPE